MAADASPGGSGRGSAGGQAASEGTIGHRLEVEEELRGKEKKKTSFMRHARITCNTILLRSLDMVDLFVKLLGPLFMLLAFSLFSFETYTYFVHVLPNDDLPLPFQAFVTCVGVFLLCNLVYNYFKAIFTDPGLPPEWVSEQVMEDGAEGLTQAETDRKPKRCPKCLRQKPVRTHHCSVCKRCVMKMDHHCPWINNCVGFHNYRYFCLFLLYLALCCFFVMITFFGPFLDTMIAPRRSRLSFGARQCISLCWIIATCILFALMLLGGFHVYLVLTNQTTIEFHSNLSRRDQTRRRGEYFRNPFDLGRARNFKQVFGPSDFCSFLWAFSFLAQPPVGDGISYPSLTEFTKA